ncbi:hypothetical protein [Alicyclobacillus fodiniaquatilis]|uniref:DUF2007 domain-containing protein n=1 Tax=Alicyclobacillus fodiniaquatilis TaxID=1661150 RepID=A0ABW4JBW1_9BACL
MNRFFKNLFSPKTLIYIAQNHDDYFRVLRKLDDCNVRYSVKTPMNLNGPVGGFSSRDTQINFYEIYVKKEDEGKAIMAINPE